MVGGPDNFIPYGKHTIDDDDIESVIKVLKSDWLTQGPNVSEFEKLIAEYCGVKYAIAVCNGTAGLHLACTALDLREGDVLWTSPITFVASANCARYCGADVDFVDIDGDTINISIKKLREKLHIASKLGKTPRLLVPVHFAGNSCEMKDIYELSQEYNFNVIEDACHALGGSYNGKKIGNCEYSQMAVLSFHPVKSITTGEGGMVLTNDQNLYEKLQLLRTNGITKTREYMINQSSEKWYYEQLSLGYNYRISDIQAALGISQLKKLDKFIERRKYLSTRYDKLLKDLPVTVQKQNANGESAWHLYVIRINTNDVLKDRAYVFNKLQEAGIGVQVHYIPVHTQPYYKKYGFNEGDFPESEKYYKQTISLPIYNLLTEQEQDRVVRSLSDILSDASW